MTIPVAATIDSLFSDAAFLERRLLVLPKLFGKRVCACRLPNPGGRNAPVLIPLRAPSASARISPSVRRGNALHFRPAGIKVCGGEAAHRCPGLHIAAMGIATGMLVRPPGRISPDAG